MKNIIYQYWQGNLKPGVIYSTKLMKEYADRIGAEYRFDHNIQIASKTVNVPIYDDPANPLVDPSFDEYDTKYVSVYYNMGRLQFIKCLILSSEEMPASF